MDKKSWTPDQILDDQAEQFAGGMVEDCDLFRSATRYGRRKASSGIGNLPVKVGSPADVEVKDES